MGIRAVASMASLFQPFDVVPHNQTRKQQEKEDLVASLSLRETTLPSAVSPIHNGSDHCAVKRRGTKTVGGNMFSPRTLENVF